MRWGVMQNDRGQPGGAQQRHPGAAQAGGAEFPCVLLCASRRRRVGSFVIAGSGEAGDGPVRITSAPFDMATQAPRRCGRKRCSFWGGWKSGWRASGKAGPMSPHPGLYSLRFHSYMADEIVRRGAAQHGLLWHPRGRRSRGWNTRWTAGRCRWSTMYPFEGVNASQWLPSCRAEEAVIQSINCCLPGAGCRFFDTVAAGRPQRGVRDRAVPTPGDGGSAS